MSQFIVGRHESIVKTNTNSSHWIETLYKVFRDDLGSATRTVTYAFSVPMSS